MNSEGFGSNGAPFEYVVEKQGKEKTTRKILLILLYVVWITVCMTIGLLARIVVPLLCFIPLSLWVLVWLTWKFTHEEIKITLFSGTLTVERQYGGKNAQKLGETKIKAIRDFVPYSKEQMEQYSDAAVIYATKGNTPDDAYILAWDQTVLVMECSEKVMKIIQYYR